MTCYPTHLHYPDTEQTRPCPILIMPNAKLGSDKAIGLTRTGLKNARSGFEPETFRFPILRERQVDALTHSPTPIGWCHNAIRVEHSTGWHIFKKSSSPKRVKHHYKRLGWQCQCQVWLLPFSKQLFSHMNKCVYMYILINSSFPKQDLQTWQCHCNLGFWIGAERALEKSSSKTSTVYQVLT